MNRPEIPPNYVRIARSVPVVAHPDSVTHWTCSAAPEEGGTHHIVFRWNQCKYCGVTTFTLRQRQLRLLTVIRDVAGGRLKAYQIESWSPSHGVYLVYYEDASGNTRRTEVAASEILRALEAVTA